MFELGAKVRNVGIVLRRIEESDSVRGLHSIHFLYDFRPDLRFSLQPLFPSR
jgi:hypothetical protein